MKQSREERREKGRAELQREKTVHPGLRSVFTKEAPMGTACLCLSECMDGRLAACKGSYYVCLPSSGIFLSLSPAGTAEPLC